MQIITHKLPLNYNIHFYFILLIPIKTDNKSPARYYKKIRKDYKKKKALQRYQNLFKEKKKSANMVKNNTRTFMNMKNKGWLRIEKSIIKFVKVS